MDFCPSSYHQPWIAACGVVFRIHHGVVGIVPLLHMWEHLACKVAPSLIYIARTGKTEQREGSFHRISSFNSPYHATRVSSVSSNRVLPPGSGGQPSGMFRVYIWGNLWGWQPSPKQGFYFMFYNFQKHLYLHMQGITL